MEELTEITSFVGENFSTDPLYAKIGERIVIVKHIDNKQKYYSLFNEYLGYTLAKELGIYTPEFGCACFKEGKTINYLSLEYRIKNNDFFTYTVLIDAVTQIESPAYIMKVDLKEILNIIIFDIFITNFDRNKGNLLLKYPKKGERPSLIPIDYTHIFPGQCIWFDVLKQPFPSIKELVRNAFSIGGHQILIENRRFDPDLIENVAKEFKDKLDKLDVKKTISLVPCELLDRYEQEDIENLERYLIRNFNAYDDIIEELKHYLVR